MVTSKCTHAAAALALAGLLCAAPAAAADPGDEGGDGATAPPAVPELSDERAPIVPPSPAPSPAAHRAPAEPALHHSPITSAQAGEPLTVRVHLEEPHLVKAARVVYRTHDGKWFTVKLLRSEDGHGAVIPADHVKAPGLAYALEIERTDGTRTPVFASRAEPQPVVVRDDAADVREEWLLGRVDRRRSTVHVAGELVRFGTTEGDEIPCGPNQEKCPLGGTTIPRIDDQYWRIEAGYTYRPLRAVSQFGIRAGVVRGTSLVDQPVYDASKYDVGLNYVATHVRFRLADIFHTDLEFLGSVTEIGFSTGAGASILLGDPLGTCFSAGWQTIGFTGDTYFGTRFFTRLDLRASERITVAPSVEVTDMPHAREFGVRLLADGGFVLGRGFTIWVRGGYQARISRSGGPAFGATVQYGF